MPQPQQAPVIDDDPFAEFNASKPKAAPKKITEPFKLDLQHDAFSEFNDPKVKAAYAQQEAQGQSELGRTFRQYALPGAAMLATGVATGGASIPIALAAGGAGMLNRGLDIKDEGRDLTSGESLADIGLTGAKDTATAFGIGKLMKAIPYQGGPIKDAMWRALMGATAGQALRTGEEGIAGVEPDKNASFGGGTIDFAKDFGLNLMLDAATQGLVRGGNRLINGKVVTPEPTGQTLQQGADQIRTELSRSGRIGPLPDPNAMQTPSVVQKPHSQATYGKGVNKVVRGGKAFSEENENRFFNVVREEYAKPATLEFEGVSQYNIEDDGTGHQRIIPTSTHPIKIVGAIPTLNTLPLATEQLKQVDKWMSGESYAALPAEMKPKFIAIRSALKKLVDGQTILDDGEVKTVPIMEWETAKEIRTQINTDSGSKMVKDFPDKMFGEINEALRKDIEFGVTNWWPNGKEAMQTLEMANAATELQKETYNRKVLNKVSGPNDVTGAKDFRKAPDPEQVLKASYTNPSEARRIAEAVGAEDRHLLSRGYFDGHLMKKAFGDNYNKFNPDFIINELESTDNSGRVYLNATERNNILRFAKAAKAAALVEEAGTKGEQAHARTVSFMGRQAVIHLTPLVAKAMGMPILGPAVRFTVGIHEIMSALKESKPLTDIASRLIKIDPNTAEAQSGLKLLLKGLQGVPVTVLDKDGKEERQFVLGRKR